MSTTPVPAGHTPGSYLARQIGCICTADENQNGAGFEGVFEYTAGQERRIRQTQWLVDTKCPVHGGGPFVPFVSGVPPKKSKS